MLMREHRAKKNLLLYTGTYASTVQGLRFLFGSNLHNN